MRSRTTVGNISIPWSTLTLAACIMATVPTGAWANVGSPAAATDELAAATPSRFGGTMILESSVGRSAFNGTEFDRQTSWNVLVSLQPTWQLDASRELTVGLRFDADMNLVESALSSSTYPHQVRPSDLLLTVDAGKLMGFESARLSLGGSAYVALPTSRYSRFSGKTLGLHGGLAATWTPWSTLEVSYGAGITKSFHRYGSAVLDAGDFTLPPLSRTAGPEQVAEGLTATGEGVDSFVVDHGPSVSFTFVETLTASVALELIHAFRGQSFPDDALTSPYADPGRGQTDIMYGSMELSWQALEPLSLALGTLVEQAPKTADNTGFRFPFWDTTNGADNRQIVYLDLIGSF